MSSSSARRVAFGAWEQENHSTHSSRAVSSRDANSSSSSRSSSSSSSNVYSMNQSGSPSSRVGGAPAGNTSKASNDSNSSAIEGNMSITSTFRQLQHKCRNVELGRADALRERDELHRLLHENQRRESLLRSRGAGHTAETLMEVKGKCASLDEQICNLKSHLVDLESAANASQDIIFVRRAELEMEEAELGQAQREKQSLASKVKDYTAETTSVRNRSNALEVRQQRSRVAAAEAEAQAKALTISAELELSRVRQEKVHSTARADALQTYMQLLLRINKDLCDAVYARELAEKQMKKFVIIPRYSWPKGVVEKAEAVLQDAAAEHALRIKRREEVKAAKKTFSNTLKGSRKPKEAAVKGGGRAGHGRNPWQGVPGPTRMAEKRPAPKPIPKPIFTRRTGPVRPAGTFAAHQHDVNLQAVRSIKSGAAVQSMARLVRPSTR